jgi:hypothetical protein
VRRILHRHGSPPFSGNRSNQKRCQLEAKNDPPVGTHNDGPKAFKVADERMKAESRNVHVFDFFRRIQEAENIFDPLDVTPLRTPSSKNA